MHQLASTTFTGKSWLSVSLPSPVFPYFLILFACWPFRLKLKTTNIVFLQCDDWLVHFSECCTHVVTLLSLSIHFFNAFLFCNATRRFFSIVILIATFIFYIIWRLNIIFKFELFYYCVNYFAICKIYKVSCKKLLFILSSFLIFLSRFIQLF